MGFEKTCESEGLALPENSRNLVLDFRSGSIFDPNKKGGGSENIGLGWKEKGLPLEYCKDSVSSHLCNQKRLIITRK